MIPSSGIRKLNLSQLEKKSTSLISSPDFHKVDGEEGGAGQDSRDD